jgi:hypothetical protein
VRREVIGANEGVTWDERESHGDESVEVKGSVGKEGGVYTEMRASDRGK